MVVAVVAAVEVVVVVQKIAIHPYIVVASVVAIVRSVVETVP